MLRCAKDPSRTDRWDSCAARRARSLTDPPSVRRRDEAPPPSRAARRLVRHGLLGAMWTMLAVGASSQATLWEVSGAVESRFGQALAVAGDVDGDGLPDLIVGAPGDDAVALDAGRVFLVRGETGAPIQAWDGEGAGDGFGTSVAGPGDVDGDGVPDVLVGAYRHSGVAPLAGRAYVFSGATFLPLHVIDGAAENDEFGVGVAAVGDVDGDGHPDFAVGAHHSAEVAQQSGSVRVYSGFTGALLYLFTGDEHHDDLGHVLSGAGDVNADGVPDIIGGLHDSVDPGQARVYSGADGATLYTFAGISNGDFYGHAVASAGDVDGDGFDDILVGASRDDSLGTNAGRVELLAGGDGAVRAEWFGAVANDQMGLSVWSAGDFDGDGCPDQILAIPGDDTAGLNAGSAMIRSGLDGSLVAYLHGVSQGLRFDSVVCGQVDLDGDGRPDVAVGFPYDDVGGLDTGRVRIWSGAEPVWSTFGAGLAGAAGVPVLSGKGSLAAGTPGALNLADAAPSALCLVAGSVGSSPAPFKGGTLYALPFALQVVLSTQADGRLVLAWPAWFSGIPSGTGLVFQMAVADGGALYGVALSNAVLGVTP